MKIERIKDLAEALNIFVGELKEVEVTGHQMNIIGELNNEFKENWDYLKNLIEIPTVSTTVETVDEEPEEEATHKLHEISSFRYNGDNKFISARIDTPMVDTEYTVHPTIDYLRFSKNSDCQTLVNGAWVPITPIIVKKTPIKGKGREKIGSMIYVRNNRFVLARLMLETFVGLPCDEKYYEESMKYFPPFFKDGDPTNCKLSNLAWGYVKDRDVKELKPQTDEGFKQHPRYPNIRMNEKGEVQRNMYGTWIESSIYKNGRAYTIPINSKLQISLGKLMLETFVGLPKGVKLSEFKGLSVTHKDGCLGNFELSNLEWANKSEIKVGKGTTKASKKTDKNDKGNTLKAEGDVINGNKAIIDILEQTKDLTLAETLLRKKAENKITFTQDDRFVAVLTCIPALKNKRNFTTRTGVNINGPAVMEMIHKKFGKQYVNKLLLNQVQNKTIHKNLCDLVF